MRAVTPVPCPSGPTTLTGGVDEARARSGVPGAVPGPGSRWARRGSDTPVVPPPAAGLGRGQRGWGDVGRLALRILVSVGILGLLLGILPRSELRALVSAFRPGVWIAGLGAYLLLHRISVEKWRLLINAGQVRLTSRHALRCYAMGLSANLFLPSLVGGDVLRAGMAMRATRRRNAVVLGSLLDRGVDVVGLVFLLALGAAVVRESLAARWAALLGGVLIAGIALALTLLILIFRLRLARWPPRLRRPLGRILVAIRLMGRRPLVLLGAALLSMSLQAGMILLNAGMARSIGVAAPLTAWFVAWPLAKLAALVPVSFGGLGVRDAALGALLAPWGVPLAAGVMAGLAWQSFVFVGGVVAGVVGWQLSGPTRGGPGEEASVPPREREDRSPESLTSL